MKQILIIDDQEDVCSILRQMLEMAGYSVKVAFHGGEGMMIYRQESIDLIVTDIFMPEKEGLETIIALRKENPDVKIIAISGGGATKLNVLPLAHKLGATRTLAKPFGHEEFLRTVREVIEENNPLAI